MLTAIILVSCGGGGFYEPVTLGMNVPKGSAAYQAGWRAGCRTALATQKFANSFVYKADYGNGTQQHDPDFITGWVQAGFACVMHSDQFYSTSSTTKFAPLSYGD